MLLLLCAPRVLAAQAATARADSTHADSVAHRLARIVVSGARLSTSSTGRDALRVDRIDAIRAPTHAAGLADLLRAQPGVNLTNDQGNRAQPTLELRGFTLSPVAGVPQGVSVFLDGVRINEPDAQEVNFDLVPMEAVERVELSRGPTAVFGKNTLGGALNLFTTRGSATPVVTASVGVGSFGERETHVIAHGAANGLDAFLLAKAAGEDGYQVQSGSTTRQLFATLGRRAERSDVAVSLLLARDALYEAGSLPESILRVSRRANFTGGDFFQPTLAQLSLRATRELPTGSLRANVFARRNAIEQFNVNADAADTRAFVTNASAGGAMELERELTLGARPLALVVGGEAAHSSVGYRVFQEPRGSASPDASCELTAPGGRALCEDAHVDGDDAALYAQSVLQLTAPLSLLASVRGDYVRLPFRDRRDAANDGTSTFMRLSPRVGVTYAATPALSMYLSAGGGFRAPAALELACASPQATCPLPFSLGADPPLRPVVAWSYEVGMTWMPAAGASVTASAFHTDVHDDIVFASVERAAGYFQNIPRTRRDGIETTFEAPLHRGVRAFGSYTLLDATYRTRVALASALDDNVPGPGDHLALSPRHRATLGVGVARAAGSTLLDATLLARAVSSQFLRGDEANHTPPLAGYAVTDLRVAAARGRMRATVSVDNLLDRRYEQFGVYAQNAHAVVEPGAPAPIERFLTPAYPRTISLVVSVEP